MLKGIFRRSEFARNSSVLIGGTLLAQVIPVALQFFLRRIFTPEEFGLMGVYFSIVSILSIGACLSYQNSIVLPKADEDGNNLVMGSLLISLFFSIGVFLVILLFSSPLINLLQLPLAISDWMFLIPVSVFFNSGHLIFSFWLTRKKAFKALAFNKVSRRSAEGVSHVALGQLWKGNGLILGTFIGDIFNFFTYLFQFKKTRGTLRVDFSKIKTLLKTYSHFPKWHLLPNIMSTISLMLPILIINAFYQEEVAGQYDLSQKLLALPLALISLSLSQILLQKMSQARNEQTSIQSFLRKIFWLLFAGTIVATAIGHFFGEDIISFAFGDQWDFAGRLTELLIFGYAIKFIVTPFTSVFIAFEELKLNSIWQIAYFGGIISLYFFPNLQFRDFILLYISIDLFFYFWYAVLIYYVMRKYERNLDSVA